MELRHCIVTRYHQTWDRILKMGKQRPRREKWWKGMSFYFYGKTWEVLNGRVPQWGEGDLLFENHFSTCHYVEEKNYTKWMVWKTDKSITGRPLDRLALFCLVILVHYWLVAALSTAWRCILLYAIRPLFWLVHWPYQGALWFWVFWVIYFSYVIDFCREFAEFCKEFATFVINSR